MKSTAERIAALEKSMEDATPGERAFIRNVIRKLRGDRTTNPVMLIDRQLEVLPDDPQQPELVEDEETIVHLLVTTGLQRADEDMRNQTAPTIAERESTYRRGYACVPQSGADIDVD